jgi:hypothetical protein
MFEVIKSSDVALEDAFSAAYNAIRVLQYRNRIRPQVYGQFLREHEATSSDEIIRLALALIREIEKREKVPVAKVNNRAAKKYESALAAAAEKRAKEELGTNSRRSKQLLKQLEEEVAMP